mmetsp:Transcript_19976/g.25935  ORF Transcript_19976/g.25935 Transcript_19976/m.25935 type:complete len:243 (-) Transcript_19976:211-939(-)
MVRVNGFARPFSNDQVLTWILFPIAVASFYLAAAPFVPDGAARITVLTVYSLLMLSVMGSWFLCSYLDPSKETDRFCPCMKESQEISRYCRTCEKHVPGLDHHCTWMNTCIGKRTYPFFYILSFCGTAMSVLHLLVGILLLTFWFDEDRAEDIVGSTLAYKVLISIVVVGAFVLIVAFGILCSFHTMLLYRGKGTYDWLIAAHEKKMEKAKKRRQDRLERQAKKEDGSSSQKPTGKAKLIKS